MEVRPGAREFLTRSGWDGAVVEPLAGDASFRRYFRVADRGRKAVLMDAPPEHEDVRPFVKIANFLVESGFSAPRLLACDNEQGFLLLEDFGDRLVGPVLKAEPDLEDDIYSSAVSVLAQLHRADVPEWLPGYDREVLLREVMLFPEWYLKATGTEVDIASYVAAWDLVWSDVLAQTGDHPVVTLRDYHADNLMLLPERAGAASLGLLDFQDALAGHAAYDLVSLLQDARRDVSPRLERAMLQHFQRAAGLADAERFRAGYEVLGAQRNVKILGIFVRLRDRDGRAGYVERLPRVWNYVDRNLAHPALAPVKQWFDTHVPVEFRADWCR